jgi:hypothetical protein
VNALRAADGLQIRRPCRLPWIVGYWAGASGGVEKRLFVSLAVNDAEDWLSGSSAFQDKPKGLMYSLLVLFLTSPESECASMQNAPKIPGDRLVLGMISVFRTLVVELSKNGAIDLDEFITAIQETAAAHRDTGDPNNLADAIHAISMHLQGSVPDPQN